MKSLYLVFALICISRATLPDCTGCFAPSSGQCKSAADVCYPASGDTCPQGTTACGGSTKYACNDNICVESSTGSFDSLSACQSSCGSSSTKYSCNTDKTCVEDASGSYDSLSACQTACGSAPSGKVIGTYYANWAQYRASPYKYTAANLSPIVNTLTHIYYGFSYFCPPSGQPAPYWAATDCAGKQPFDFVLIDPKDASEINTMKGFKSQNANLKLIAAIGGWTFPSAFFSTAVKPENQKTFVAAIKTFTEQYGFDGINFDWEYPCSEPRHDAVKITCTDIKDVTDEGGDCASKQYAHGICSGDCEDGDNLVSFLTLLKQSQPNLEVSIAQSASPFAMSTLPIAKIDKVLDYWNLMSYDYFVSDIDSADKTAPNQNLHTVSALGVPKWSASDSIEALLANGATASKVLFGVAMYGHTYYVPGITDNSWQAFGLPAQVEGECCGLFKSTYGGAPGKGSSQCGTLMYSEVEAAGFETYYDNSTASAIGYLPTAGKDGHTAAGTWISYMDKQSVKTQVDYAMSMGLGGSFSWDCSMDSIENGAFTYELSHQLADSVNSAVEHNLQY